MNLRTTQINTMGKRSKPRVRRRNKSEGFSFTSFVKIAFPVFILFLLAAALNVFNSETEQLNRNAVKLQTEINQLDRQIANYNIKAEKLKGRFIYKQVAYFKLKLRSPVPGQVLKLRLPRERIVKKSSKPQLMLISQR